MKKVELTVEEVKFLKGECEKEILTREEFMEDYEKDSPNYNDLKESKNMFENLLRKIS